MVKVVALNGEGRSSRVLLKMRLVVYRSYLQGPTYVVFERLNESFGYGGGGEKKKKKKKNVERSERKRDIERE